MIKNLNDILSLISLVILVIYALKIFVWSIVDDDHHIDNARIIDLLRDYNNNTEE